MRLWQSLRPAEKEQLLTTGRVAGIAPAVVYVAVLAGAVVTGTRDALGSEFQQRRLNGEELDAIDQLKSDDFGGGLAAARSELVGPPDLDYFAP